MKLAYLVFAGNTAYCTVTEMTPKGVTVDLEKMTWQYDHAHLHQPVQIGRSRYLGCSPHGTIGVYDLDNFAHVDRMVHDAIESQRDYSNAD